MLTDVQRQLTDGERERLRKEAARAARARVRRLWHAVRFLSVVGLIGCVWTLAASDVSATVVVPIWLGITGLLILLTRHDIWKDVARRVRHFESALSSGFARVLEIEASAVVVHPEFGSWAYQVDGPRIVFVNFDEDEYPEAAGAPSRQLIVQVLTADGLCVDETSESGGGMLSPNREIEPSVLRRLRWPEHLTVLDGRLEDLPSLLGQSR